MRRDRGAGILGPVMFGIPTTQFFPHMIVRTSPEIFEIVRDLLCSVVRAEQMKLNRYLATRNSRALMPAEEFLNSDFHSRRLAIDILHADAISTRHRDPRRCLSVNRAELFISE